MPLSRDEILARLRTKIAGGRPIIGGGAGTGISAKCEEAGGIDLIVVYNSGRYRMAGRGSLAGLMPFGNANEIVREMAREVVTAVVHTPVLAGVCATDPFLLREQFLRELTQPIVRGEASSRPDLVNWDLRGSLTKVRLVVMEIYRAVSTTEGRRAGNRSGSVA